ncbi:MAG: hypothetical protein R2715_17630 [Ilumatobacteraceae bacterium]
MSRPTRAIVRRPSPRIADGEVTHLARVPLDVELAHAQHHAYCELLAGLGLSLVIAPDAPEHPDGLFVEDALVMLAGRGVLTRPGALSRRGEVDSIAPLLPRSASRCRRSPARGPSTGAMCWSSGTEPSWVAAANQRRGHRAARRHRGDRSASRWSRWRSPAASI